MRNSFRKLLCRSALLLAAVAAPALRADDLDALLAQPPSASLGKEDAAKRIEMLRALIPDHPDRADEIEAYLIPFARVTEPPPAEPEPEPPPPPAKAKPLLLVRNPDGALSTLRAASRKRQGAVVMAVEEKGGRAVLQASAIAGELSWFTDAELESGAVDLNALARSYEAIAKAMPSLRGELGAEAERFRGLQRRRKHAAAEKAAAVEARLARVVDAQYDPAAGYTAPGLARQLLDAEKARRELPQFAEKIDAWAEPFRAHFAKLLGGNVYADGKWVSGAELERRAREARQEKFLRGLDYQISARALPPGALRGLLEPYFFKGGFGMLAGLAALAFGWRRIPVRLAGAGLVAISALGLGLVLFLATRNPAGMPLRMAMAEEQAVVDALSQAAGLDSPAAASRPIAEASLNSFASRHVRIAGGDSADEEGRRQSVVVRLLPGRFAIFEMVRGMGLSWIVRIDLVADMAGAPPALAGARMGALECPPDFAAALWKNLEPQLGAILAASRVRSAFAIQPPRDGSVDLEPAAGPADGAH